MAKDSNRDDAVRTTTKYIRELRKQEAKLVPALEQTRKELKQYDDTLLDLVDKSPDDSTLPGMEDAFAKPKRPPSLTLFAKDIKDWAEKEKRGRGRPPKEGDEDDGDDLGDGEDGAE